MFARVHRIVIASCFLSAFGSPALAQCPDNAPPPGPLAYKYKNLDQVEPARPIDACNTPGNASATYLISAPGSYYLTGNLVGSAGKVGIQINANEVTIDLRGFTMSGGGGTFAISIANNIINTRIFNGNINGWSQGGCNAPSANWTRLERVTINNCTGIGARLGQYAVVEDSRAYSMAVGVAPNVGQGFVVGAAGSIRKSDASNNAGAGFTLGAGSRIVDSIANANSGVGIEMNLFTSPGPYSSASNCTAYLNAGVGINLGKGCSVRDSTIEFGAQDGIVCADSSSVIGCTITRSTPQASARSGVYAPANACVIRDNSITGAGTANGWGITLGAASARCRIEGNNCSNSETGISATTPGNFVLRNTCSANTTNFSVVVGNLFSVTSAPSSSIEGTNYSLP